ncbi:GGDEF domain-containing protein [Sphingomonas alba]|uniref:diguanylate cyclase n=1 Tax=Sphingomonas alba TaxID=2908208 RepID=A0ABT0RLN2_9SPHN|nr:diguanylate cyclase [Sphingomonas alba]MCL6683559.1 diguanylate cyclase [Sphingomonas alba]
MDQRVISVDPETLVAEISRLRAEVARLESRVEELDRLANMDSLVPVANRRGLVASLDRMIARQERHGTPSALLFVDVDGLKALNDAFGHSAGDAALIHLTEMMVASVRQTDMVARIGGDEFAILLDHADEKSAEETAARLADQVADCEFCFGGKCLPLSIAIGFTVLQTGDSPASVLDRADEAMYREKDAA